MIVEHRDSRGRLFRFERTGEQWDIEITPPNFGDPTAVGSMPVARDWKGDVIVSGVVLYRLGAGRHLYGMTVRDEVDLTFHHLDFLESTKRSPKRIEKTERRLKWLTTMEASGHVYMEPEWDQGATV